MKVIYLSVKAGAGEVSAQKISALFKVASTYTKRHIVVESFHYIFNTAQSNQQHFSLAWPDQPLVVNS